MGTISKVNRQKVNLFEGAPKEALVELISKKHSAHFFEDVFKGASPRFIKI